MDNYSKIYWLTRLDSLHGAFITLFIISILGLIFYNLFATIELEEEDKPKWVNRTIIPFLIISSIGLLFIPTKNEIILIYAGGKTMDFVQQDSSLNKIPEQTTKIVSDYLDKTIKELDK